MFKVYSTTGDAWTEERTFSDQRHAAHYAAQLEAAIPGLRCTVRRVR